MPVIPPSNVSNQLYVDRRIQPFAPPPFAPPTYDSHQEQPSETVSPGTSPPAKAQGPISSQAAFKLAQEVSQALKTKPARLALKIHQPKEASLLGWNYV
ncbi:MAG: hypothetical protein JRJ59_00615 [Deltaproteobacteria bacterium]|nr:hypothetical protein [Deltaproteobacteria bacterium]